MSTPVRDVNGDVTQIASPAPRRRVPASAVSPGTALLLLLGVATGVGLGGALMGVVGCSDPCCTTDGFPINLEPRTNTDLFGLVATARDSSGQGFRMSIDTGSPLTFFRRQSEKNQLVLRDFDILDAQGPTATVVRGEFRGIEVLPLELQPAPGPDAVLGGVLLQNFSVQFDFAKPAMTFWSRQGASAGFLSAAGFAVIHFNLQGGAELTAESRPDFLGLTGPVEVPPTRVVLRACGGAPLFDPMSPEPEACCNRIDAVTNAKGTDLALVVATGVGPLVLSQSAWNRITAGQADPLPTPVAGDPLPVPSLPTPLTDVLWSTLPRLALVNQELDDATNPGPCVDLGRARRLEWVENHPTNCIQPCDSDPRDSGKAQNAAAYVEFGPDIRVAIVPDGTALLQGLRAEIRPEGPEVDGLIGANVFSGATVELDYKSKPGRAVIAPAPGKVRTPFLVSPRCPRLSELGDQRACFGLTPPRSLTTTMCDKVPVCP